MVDMEDKTITEAIKEAYWSGYKDGYFDASSGRPENKSDNSEIIDAYLKTMGLKIVRIDKREEKDNINLKIYHVLLEGYLKSHKMCFEALKEAINNPDKQNQIIDELKKNLVELRKEKETEIDEIKHNI